MYSLVRLPAQARWPQMGIVKAVSQNIAGFREDPL